jgi:UDP-glucose 4-epimerase
MRILLVGGLGFIGRHLVDKLRECGDATVLSTSEDTLKNAAFVESRGLHIEIGDIMDGAGIKKVMLRQRPDSVVHLAALTGISKCEENPSLAFAVNVLGTRNVVMGCVACGSKLVFISSREVYGEGADEPTREDDPLVPNNTYGLTKLLGERLVTWAASRHGLDHTILRVTNGYGPGGERLGIQTMIQKALTERKIAILGGHQEMNLIYVEDVAEAIQRCLFDARSSRQTFNIGGTETLSVEAIVSRLISLVDLPVKIERFPMREGETLNFQPSLEKIERALGFRPTVTLDEGLHRTVEWCKEKLRTSGT